MSGVFRNIDPPLPHRPASVYPPPLVRGKDSLGGEGVGVGVNGSEDARHCSVFSIFKYFVRTTQRSDIRPRRVRASAFFMKKGNKFFHLKSLECFLLFFFISLSLPSSVLDPDPNPDPDPLVRCMIRILLSSSKNSKKNFKFYCSF